VALTDPALTSEDRQVKLSEAESLVIESGEALLGNKAATRHNQRDALVLIVRFYEAAIQPGKVAEWQRKLDTFDKAATEPETAEPKADTGAVLPEH
jgi:hypothetical protein